ncbi:tetratricopeptide repeat protein [Streptomyces sp. DSM 40750]|uniref:tetratricopeptide repeat protein n=1 Tax=Streptomyces sp. DSM 40750 TaxID=2801030 RepID=UPI00214C76DD|nr:tetratricopeptide repeat protein [Streptomyces sp. DSM 40750]UUU23939.1 NB-ARC domain-containing protein [Streptomyces sp. DSM 40750]
MLPAEAFSLDSRAARVCHLPDRTGQFVGRERELRLLDAAFGEAGGLVVHAVHGLGGIGKSTLAAHWAAVHAADFNPVWWITAETETDLDSGFAALGRALQPALVGILTEEAFRERTIQWLASNGGWLIVLDNVSDPAVIRPLLARAPGGRFLVTTRRSSTSWRGIARTLDLDVLAPAEAVELFTGIYDGPADGVEELCAELGCLPLAVDQAAAYCREAGVTPRVYLDFLARYPADMYAATAEGGDAQRTVARVWQVTLDALADTPIAVQILRIIAWWAPDEIPRGYLEGIGSPLEVTDAVRRLAAHSMVKVRGDVLSVHRLVQAVSRAGTPEEMAVTRHEAARMLSGKTQRTQVFGEAERVWATHVEALAGCLGEEFDTELLVSLFTMAAMNLTRGHSRRSMALLERVARAVERNPGWDSRETVRGAMLPMYMLNGHYDLAQPLAEEQLALSERERGACHPDTFSARISLADVLRHTEPERAQAMAQEVAERAVEALGSDHPVAFTARLTLREMTRQHPDRPTFEAQVAEAERVLGDDHFSVAVLRRNLVEELREAGHLDRAVVLAEKVVAQYRHHLGATDMDTLNARITHIHLLALVDDAPRVHELLPDFIADLSRAVGDTPEGRNVIDQAVALLRHREA